MTEKIPHIRTITVTPGQQPERVDRFITDAVMGATRNRVQEAIDAGALLVNDKPTRASYRVRPGDVITITLMKPPPIVLSPQDIPLDIVYEDDDLLVVNKPAGMVTHPGFGNRDGTLVNAVLFHTGGMGEPAHEQEAETSGEESDGDDEGLGADRVRPGIVHRLDKDTSGLMVVVKHAEAHAFLAKQFAERTVGREYRAVAWGVFTGDEGEIEGNISRSPRDRKIFTVTPRGGKYALTRWKVAERFEFTTLISLRLATGRTHQIRVHCAHIRHPIFGDPAYGGRHVVHPGSGGRHRQRVLNLLADMPRQALHAGTLGFIHPRTRRWMEFDSELPADMVRLIEHLRGTVSPAPLASQDNYP